jgi:hypothetical protein
LLAIHKLPSFPKPTREHSRGEHRCRIRHVSDRLRLSHGVDRADRSPEQDRCLVSDLRNAEIGEAMTRGDEIQLSLVEVQRDQLYRHLRP